MRRRGLQIAELHPAFWFECEKCHGPVALISQECAGHYHPADGAHCDRCGIDYPVSFVRLLHAARATSPCSWWDCPSCESTNVILSDPIRDSNQVPVFAGRQPKSFEELMNFIEADEVQQVGTIQLDRYQWEVPTMRVCNGCNKPVRLATNGMQGMISLRPETLSLEGLSS